MRPRISMYDRMKSNGGYLAGPDHPMHGNAAVYAAEEGAPATGNVPPVAPNLREADDPMQNCGSCIDFDVATKDCQRFKFQTIVTQVCDDWADEQRRPKVNPPSDPADEEGSDLLPSLDY